jgi:hypothetical protein
VWIKFDNDLFCAIFYGVMMTEHKIASRKGG